MFLVARRRSILAAIIPPPSFETGITAVYVESDDVSESLETTDDELEAGEATDAGLEVGDAPFTCLGLLTSR